MRRLSGQCNRPASRDVRAGNMSKKSLYYDRHMHGKSDSEGVVVFVRRDIVVSADSMSPYYLGRYQQNHISRPSLDSSFVDSLTSCSLLHGRFELDGTNVLCPAADSTL